MWPITILRDVLQLLVEKKLRKLLIKIFKYEKYLQNDIPAAFNGTIWYCTMLICISAIILFYMFLFFLPFNTVLVVFVL